MPPKTPLEVNNTLDPMYQGDKWAIDNPLMDALTRATHAVPTAAAQATVGMAENPLPTAAAMTAGALLPEAGIAVGLARLVQAFPKFAPALMRLTPEAVKSVLSYLAYQATATEQGNPGDPLQNAIPFVAGNSALKSMLGSMGAQMIAGQTPSLTDAFTAGLTNKAMQVAPGSLFDALQLSRQGAINLKPWIEGPSTANPNTDLPGPAREAWRNPATAVLGGEARGDIRGINNLLQVNRSAPEGQRVRILPSTVSQGGAPTSNWQGYMQENAGMIDRDQARQLQQTILNLSRQAEQNRQSRTFGGPGLARTPVSGKGHWSPSGVWIDE